MAGRLAYGATGAANRVGEQVADFNSRYNEERQGPFTPAFKVDDDYDNGPKHPYPIRFKAHCDGSSGKFPERHILPVTKLIDVPEVAAYKLCGHYFGWCATPPERLEKHGRIHKRHHWFQAVIVVSPIDIDTLDRISMSRANQKEIQIQILADGQDQPPSNAEITVEVLGCLRPWDEELEKMLVEDMQVGEEVAFETASINEMKDIELAQLILDSPNWGPEAASEQEKTDEPKPKLHGMERLKKEYTEKRLAVEKKIDKVPLHKVGVRMPVDRMRDGSVVVNGYYIKR